MTKTKSTKRALLMSALSLLLCFSMLIGSTFAWFTDSVTSGKNVIAAGNLDIELTHTNAKVTDADVEGATDLFVDENGEAILWEPGAVAYETFTVKNAGSLDLKYDFAINFTNENFVVEADGTITNFGLSSALSIALVKQTPANRADAIVAGETAGWKSLKSFHLPSSLKAGAEETYTLVIYWKPSSLDDNWNVNNNKTVTDNYTVNGEPALRIDLGIHLKATQLVSESDAFGPDYDKLAPWTGAVGTVPAEENGVITITTGEELAGLAAEVNKGNTYEGKTIQLGADIDLNDVAWTPIGIEGKSFGGSFDGNGYTIYNLTVSGTEGVGLIGFAGNAAHIEDVKIVGAHVSGNHWVGTVLGYGYLAANTLKGCYVEDATVICTPVLKGGVYDDGDKVGAIAGMAINGNILDNTAKDCVVMGYRDVGGIVGLAQAENRDIQVQGNKVTGITMVYAGVLSEYADGTPNQNMDYYVGRVNNHGGYTVTVNGNYKPDGACYETVATIAATEEDMAKALNAGGNVVLVADMEVSETIEVAEGVKTTLYLNGKEIVGNVPKNAGAVLENAGELTIVGNGSDILANEAINGGAVINNTGALVLDGATIEGASIGTTGYPEYAITSSGNLTIEEGTKISADRGALRLLGTGKTVINGGSFVSNNIDRALTSHVVYVADDSTNELTINGGTFQHLDTETSGGVVINNSSKGTVYVNGGNFSGGNYWNESNLSTYGYGGTFAVTGGTYTHFKDAFLVAGYKTVDHNGKYVVVAEEIDAVASSGKELDEALAGGNDVVLTDDLNFSSSDTTANSGYGATGVSVKGNTLDGNGNSLGVNNWDTWDSAVHTTGGTIKNLTINSGMRGIFMGSADADVYIDNVIIDGTIYTFNSDGGNKNYGVYISNSTLNGWTSFSDVHKEVVFTNCNFGEGNGYAFCRPYNAATFVDCVFEEGFAFDTSCSSSILFVNCYYGDTLITEENALTVGTGDDAFFYNGIGGLKFPTKVPAAGDLGAALTDNKYVELSGDVQFAAPIKNDAVIDLAGNTFEATGSYTLGNDADFTMSNGEYVTNGTFGHIDVRPDTAEGSVITFENVDFTTTKKNPTYGTCTDRLNSVVEITPNAAGAHVVAVFKNCTFDNAKVYFEGMSGTVGSFEAIFENCTFKALTSSSPIEVQNYIEGTITVKNCTFNLECTSSSAAAICVSPSNSTTVTIIAENNTINAVAATPYTHDAAAGETAADDVKVLGTPKNIKLISSYGNTTVTETDTVKTGIAG